MSNTAASSSPPPYVAATVQEEIPRPINEIPVGGMDVEESSPSSSPGRMAAVGAGATGVVVAMLAAGYILSDKVSDNASEYDSMSIYLRYHR